MTQFQWFGYTDDPSYRGKGISLKLTVLSFNFKGHTGSAYGVVVVFQFRTKSRNLLYYCGGHNSYNIDNSLIVC